MHQVIADPRAERLGGHDWIDPDIAALPASASRSEESIPPLSTESSDEAQRQDGQGELRQVFHHKFRQGFDFIRKPHTI